MEYYRTKTIYGPAEYLEDQYQSGRIKPELGVVISNVGNQIAMWELQCPNF